MPEHLHSVVVVVFSVGGALQPRKVISSGHTYRWHRQSRVLLWMEWFHANVWIRSSWKLFVAENCTEVGIMAASYGTFRVPINSRAVSGDIFNVLLSGVWETSWVDQIPGWYSNTIMAHSCDWTVEALWISLTIISCGRSYCRCSSHIATTKAFGHMNLIVFCNMLGYIFGYLSFCLQVDFCEVNLIFRAFCSLTSMGWCSFCCYSRQLFQHFSRSLHYHFSKVLSYPTCVFHEGGCVVIWTYPRRLLISSTSHSNHGLT